MGSIIGLLAGIICVTLLAIVIAVATGASNIKKQKNSLEKRKEVTTDPYIVTGMERKVFNLYIAGLKHHCTDGDIGIFTGAVYNETSNPKDRKAMAVVNAQKKLLGYIPAKRLEEYWDWCGGETRSCAGYIFWNGNMLLGRVRIYPNADDMSKTQEDASQYLAQVVTHFGWELNDDGTMK